jgi:glutamine amidotransferase
MIAIIDYGAGNLVSVKKSIDWLGCKAIITADPAEVAKVSGLVLPGVGHFASMKALCRSGMQAAITDAIRRGVPILGICLGMQWMFEGSTESPETPGLALFPGRCERFPANVKSPHVGWNSIEIRAGSRLLGDINPASFLYFTHSFQAPICEATIGCCEYGQSFSAAVERDNLFGVQFHPEKSGEVGLRILGNFCGLSC